jgi:hypothetical protein
MQACKRDERKRHACIQALGASSKASSKALGANSKASSKRLHLRADRKAPESVTLAFRLVYSY